MDFGEPSPFQKWMDEHMQGMAVSADIRELLALAFEGGRQSTDASEAERLIADYIKALLCNSQEKAGEVTKAMVDYFFQRGGM